MLTFGKTKLTTINQTSTRFQLTKEAEEILGGNPTEEELGLLFENQQFSPELEEYLFECMDNCPEDKSYIELVQEILTRLHSLVA